MSLLKYYSNYFCCILVCCLIFLSGCASRIPIGKYELLKDSSESLYLHTIDTYSKIEQLQKRFAITTAPNSKINRNTFKPQIAGESYDLTPELRFREAALQVLVDYAAILQAFSSKDYMSQVDNATQHLAGSLNNLLETSKSMEAVDGSKISGILATLVNKISKQFIQQKKEEALKQVMHMAQPDIEQLSKLITESNAKIKIAVGIMLNRIMAHANSARPEYGTAERYEFDKEIANIITEVEGIESAIEVINAAISEFPQAHQEIRTELDKKQTTFKSLQILIQEANQAKRFYQHLKN